MKNRILITGGTGFFGKSILDYANRYDTQCELVTLARTAGDIISDVRRFDVGNMRFDYIIHAATPVGSDRLPDDAELSSIIIDGTSNILKQAEKCGCRRVMLVSSGGVYGRGFSRNISETDLPQPVTAYGKAKLVSEQMALESGLDVVIPRCFALTGKFLRRDIHYAIGNFIAAATSNRDIVINGDGTPIRSYMYADDLVEWLFAILERGRSGCVYNVGSDRAISIKDLATLVKDTLGSACGIKILGKDIPGAADYYVPNIDAAKCELGLSLKTGLQDAIIRTCGRIL